MQTKTKIIMGVIGGLFMVFIVGAIAIVATPSPQTVAAAQDVNAKGQKLVDICRDSRGSPMCVAQLDYAKERCAEYRGNWSIRGIMTFCNDPLLN